MPEFNDVLTSDPAVSKPLHLTHGTYAGNLEAILKAGGLEAKPCPTLQQSLVFSFYGRPAYEPRSDGQSDHEVARAPIYLVLEPAVIDEAANIYPFDTGGHPQYAAHLGSPLTWQDFKLENKVDSPRRVVDRFYDGNADYFGGWPKAGASHGKPSLDAYAKLIASHRTPDDGRRSAIEVSFGPDTLALTGRISLIVGPHGFFDRPEIKTALAPFPCLKATYPLHNSFFWNDFKSGIQDRIRVFLERQGSL